MKIQQWTTLELLLLTLVALPLINGQSGSGFYEITTETTMEPTTTTTLKLTTPTKGARKANTSPTSFKTTAARTLRLITPRKFLQDSRCRLSLVRDRDFGNCGTALRYYYSATLGRCIGYFGCVSLRGSNNFFSQEECEKLCYPPEQRTLPTKAPWTTASQTVPRKTTNPSKTTKPARATKSTYPPITSSRCNLSVYEGSDYGTCPGANNYIRFTYRRDMQQCVGFVGCITDGNNFGTANDCQQECMNAV